MHPTISRYVERVRSICEEPLSDAGRLRRIRAAAADLVKEPLPLDEDLRRIPEGEGYGRNLIYRDPDHGFVVIAMVWPPNTGGDPHDHQTWGVVAVAEGTVRIENFVRLDDGHAPEHADLEEACTIEGTPGAVGYVLPPHEDIHAISNPSPDAMAISIHTYGRDIVDCNLFRRDSGAVEPIHLGYHNE